ncbi:hypothetical protein O6U65_1730 [Saccharomyces cerevisiae synthetic construct]|nr:hypothetical protein O6U65_1730 [Saccharomyces cerevisiae synthetic construct]
MLKFKNMYITSHDNFIAYIFFTFFTFIPFYRSDQSTLCRCSQKIFLSGQRLLRQTVIIVGPLAPFSSYSSPFFFIPLFFSGLNSIPFQDYRCSPWCPSRSHGAVLPSYCSLRWSHRT